MNNSTMASKDTTTRAAAGVDITKVATWVDQATTMTETTHSQEEVEVLKEAHQREAVVTTLTSASQVTIAILNKCSTIARHSTITMRSETATMKWSQVVTSSHPEEVAITEDAVLAQCPTSQ